MTTKKTTQSKMDATELTDEQLNEASGGIAIIGRVRDTANLELSDKLSQRTLNFEEIKVTY